ncbi:MAG: hypothetical protein ACQEUZ_04585 [Pseudomonadota bacterium]
MSRSMTFTIEGPVDTRVTIEELADGTLRFDIVVLGSGLLGDLRGLFFDLKDFDATGAGLSVEGVDGSEDLIGMTVFEESGVDRARSDSNVRGEVLAEQGRFDAGIEFGTPGIGEDDVSSASFILSADALLSLDSLDLADFGLRYTSVGTGSERSGSAKIVGDASGVARNDAWEVDENAAGAVDLLANDTNGVQADGSRKTVVGVADAEGDLVAVAGGFQRVVEIGGLVLGTLFVSDDGVASFAADGPDIDKLAHDDIRTWSFTYETVSTVGDLATADVVLTIDGQNDQPNAFDLSLSVGEDDAFDTVQSDQFHSLVGDGVTGAFVGTDIDIGDVLSFEIVSAPTDASGNQYGEVVNNGDGTFTFNPLDEFQFLDAGETRVVTFQYVAVDDSGVGTSPAAPEESDTSDPATVSITVIGEEDAPVSFADRLLFETQNQSMFGTGEALLIQPDLPFFGFDTGTQSLNATIYGGDTFSGGVLGDILEGIDALADFFGDVGCTIAGWFGDDDCDSDVPVPDSITVPGVGTEGSFSAVVGLQPYFGLNTGEVDASIPVDVVFTAPRQVENGDTFTIGSLYTTDGGATFSTMSPNVNFGMDFVFDIDTALDLLVGGNRIDLWDLDTGGDPDFTGELGQPGFNIFDASGDDLELSVPLGPFDPYFDLDLNFPVINTTGDQDAPGGDVLNSSGSDDVAVLTADLDAFASTALFGFPSAFGDSDSFGLSTSIGGVGLNLLSVEWNWDIVSLALSTTLEAVQDFTLSIQDLPLMATLEDGSTISGFSLGDEITVVTPDDSVFDADIDGNADGLMDFDVSVDMEAMFANDTYLGLGLDLFAGLLRFDAGITSDFFSGPSVSLFDGIIPSVDGNSDGFLFGDTFELASVDRLATLFDEEFALEGWNTPTTDTPMFYDVA